MISVRALGTISMAATLLASAASAGTLTFDTVFTGPVYTEAGMTIERQPASDRDVNTTGSALGWTCCTGAFYAEYKLSTGNTFSLVGFNAVHIDAEDPITFEGWAGGSMIISATYSGLFNFPALLGGFDNLDYAIMKINSVAYGDPQIDDLEFIGETAAGPVPAALPLLGGALAGLVALRRRRA